MTDDPVPHHVDSLVDRLRERLGSDFDPRVTLPGSEARQDPGSDSNAGAEAAPESSGVLSRLGARAPLATRYRLKGEIARGGMGAILEVWDEDLRRRLAMKVALGRRGEGSKATTDELDPRILARFLEEAQVTGQLEHPGIVPVHELGLDENGQVYFTMRLVRGRDLERIFHLVADGDEGWSVTRALGVLLKVCETMAYAHTRGVVHRDLKPANVMVGHFGEVYVMDWGLVRVQGHEDRHDLRLAAEPAPAHPSGFIAIDRRETSFGEDTEELYTLDGDVIGTPAYMAPEQARGELDALDARTDVYSLGAMLYRLLAGIMPYGKRGVPPSATAILIELLKGPPTPLEVLNPSVPGELVAISEKAMTRDPAGRYADMGALGEDLRAYLEHRVVGAYETGAVAEARKWVRRNRPLAASLAAGLLVLVGGLAASLVLKQRADDNAVLAEERRGEAEEAARLAKLAELHSDSNAKLAEQRLVLADASAARALESAREAEVAAQLAEERRLAADASAAEAERQARIAKEVNSFLNDDLFAAVDPAHSGVDVTVRQVLETSSLRLGLFKQEPLVEAELRVTFGNCFVGLGELGRASDNLERAVALRREALGDRDPATLAAQLRLAAVRHEAGRHEEALALYESVLAIARVDLGPEHDAVLVAMSDVAVVLQELGRYDRAEPLYQEVLEVSRRLRGEEHPETLKTLNNYGNFLEDLGKFEQAEGVLRSVLELRRKKSGKQHPQTVIAMNNLAQVLVELGRYKEAEQLHRDAHEIRVEILGAGHPDVGVGLSNLGALLIKRGRWSRAEEALEQAVPILVQTLGPEHPNTLLAKSSLALVYDRRGRKEEALDLRLETLAGQRRLLGDEHPDTLTSMGNLAIALRDFDRDEESEAMQREVLELERRVLGVDHPDTLVTLENLGGTLFRRGDMEGSLELTAAVLEARRRVLGPDHPDVAKTTYNMGMIANSMGDPDGALDWFEQALAINLRSVGRVHPNAAECQLRIGEMQLEAERYEPAARAFDEAAAVRRELDDDALELAYLLHQASYCWGKADELEPALERSTEAVELRRSLLGDTHPTTLVSLYVLARLFLRAERFAESEALAYEYHEAKLDAEGPEGPEVARIRQHLIELYEAWGKPDEAELWR